MSSKWHQKKKKLELEAFERELRNAPDDTTVNVVTEVAMGGGDEELFEKKLTKEEKKALAKAKRDAKRKGKSKGSDKKEGEDDETNGIIAKVLQDAAVVTEDDGEGGINNTVNDGVDHAAADALAAAGTICTFSQSRKGIDPRSRDINVQNFTLQHHGAVMLDHTSVVLNHGNRYGLIGRNGTGKSTLLKAIGARAIPVPDNIDIFILDQEVEASDELTALDMVMSVDKERLKLEQQAEELNDILTRLSEQTTDGGGGDDNAESENNDEEGMTLSLEEQQEQIIQAVTAVYDRLDALDAATAEVRARSILAGLGFTHEMQGKLTRDFSGGWRMRVALARALFLQPCALLLDEPTNHLDMEAVIWLEDYLSKWNRILLLISHSQDFLNNVCTHMIEISHNKHLVYYDGNYDQYVKTKTEKLENQWKQYKGEQEQIKSMKEYIARFGHGTAKNAKQAQSKEKVLAKMLRSGLTEKPVEEKPLNFQFPNPGHLPPPVLAFHNVKFGYPGCEPLYSNVNFGVDLDSRVALVGPNGAGKTTLIKLMAGELTPTLGDIRPHGHLKMGRFTQHFVDVLDLDLTPLEFFQKEYPNDAHEEQRKYLGRFGVSGKMQVQKMRELSDGQKSRVVFAKLGRDGPHILLLDEPTNHLDMESIDALAKAVNEFEGGLVLVSHDMRLIGQVAKEIWICDNKTITPYKGDIQSFKMNMRAQMGLEGDEQKKQKLRGDFSVKQKDEDKPKKKPAPAPTPKLEVVVPKKTAPAPPAAKPDDDDATTSTTATGTSLQSSTAPAAPPAAFTTAPKGRYIPPHLRKKMQQEQQS